MTQVVSALTADEVTRNFWDTIPDSLRAHLDCPIVDKLRPITQKHAIEGLMMGEA